MHHPQDEDHYRELRLYCGATECLIQRPGKKPLPRKQTIGYLVYMTDDPVIPKERDSWYFWTFRSVEGDKPGALVDVMQCPRCGRNKSKINPFNTGLSEFFIDSHSDAKQTSLNFLCERGLIDRLDVEPKKRPSTVEYFHEDGSPVEIDLSDTVEFDSSEYHESVIEQVRDELISEFEAWNGPDAYGDDRDWYRPELPPSWR